MNATLVSLSPSPTAKAAGRPELTPELMAAVMARYSRNNEGLPSILSKISPDPVKAVDSVFRMVDYGHASIGDMCPVGIFLDDVSIWAAYLIWSLCPTRVDLPIAPDGDLAEDELLGGQESSTRYIKLSADGLPSAADLGIQDEAAWKAQTMALFEVYQKATEFWQAQAARDLSVLRIPSQLLNDSSEKAQKQVDRLRRNYAFDRARYFLPVAATTNMAMVMPARTWAALCQYLLSSNLTELCRLGAMIQRELELGSPNLVRHAIAKDYTRDFINQEFADLVERFARRRLVGFFENLSDWAVRAVDLSGETNEDLSCSKEAKCHPSLFIDFPGFFPNSCTNDYADAQFAAALKYHTNRYAPFGRALRMTAVRFGWSAVSLAEIRDLNRHRTGQKDVCHIPVGFYCAKDQIVWYKPPTGIGWDSSWADTGGAAVVNARKLLKEGNPGYVYWLPLGVQFSFEHVTTADKYIYEAELRTGTGAHYRYASHLRDSLERWYQRFPTTRGLIKEGTAEPE